VSVGCGDWCALGCEGGERPFSIVCTAFWFFSGSIFFEKERIIGAKGAKRPERLFSVCVEIEGRGVCLFSFLEDFYFCLFFSCYDLRLLSQFYISLYFE